MSQPTPPPDDGITPLLDDPGARAWFEQHLTTLRQDAYGPRILYSTLIGAFVAGFVAYIVGYVLRSSATTEPLGLLADMLYTLGFALWTAAVVVVLLEVVPDVKRRQIKRALEAYEAKRRDLARNPGTDVVQDAVEQEDLR